MLHIEFKCSVLFFGGVGKEIGGWTNQSIFRPKLTIMINEIIDSEQKERKNIQMIRIPKITVKKSISSCFNFLNLKFWLDELLGFLGKRADRRFFYMV